MPESISCICTISLHYRFFLQKANLNIIQYSLGTAQFLAFLHFMVGVFQFLHIETTDSLCSSFARKCLAAFLAFVQFLFSIDSAFRKYIRIFCNILYENCGQSLHLYGFHLVWNSSVLLDEYSVISSNKFHFQKDLMIFEIGSFMGFQENKRSSTFLAFIWLVSFMDSSWSSESILHFF